MSYRFARAQKTSQLIQLRLITSSAVLALMNILGPPTPINELWRALSHWQQPVGREAEVFNTGEGPGTPPPPRHSSSISERRPPPLPLPLPLPPTDCLGPADVSSLYMCIVRVLKLLFSLTQLADSEFSVWDFETGFSDGSRQ